MALPLRLSSAICKRHHLTAGVLLHKYTARPYMHHAVGAGYAHKKTGILRFFYAR